MSGDGGKIPHDGKHAPRDPERSANLDRLLASVDSPHPGSRRLARQLIHTALQLLADGGDVGEMKLITRSVRELRYALKVFRPYRDTQKVSIFGSARTPPEHPDYRAAVRFGQAMAAGGWMVITGAGDGIMKAGHEGAGVEHSFGVSIRLPFETSANDIIRDDPKLIAFRYFFTRKLMFVWEAHALALLPGGFGTLDEGFEVLTLIQTGKAPMIPVVMLAPRANDYWQHFDHYVRERLLPKGLIGPEDLSLYHIFDDADAAAQHVLHFYRNYHSQRMVGDRLVLRLHRPLGEADLDALNGSFSDIVADGRIEQGGPLEGEQSHLGLPRLNFTFAQRNFGRMRQLIDRINQFD